MHALIQVLKVNDLREGVSTKSGTPRQWQMQDAECLLLKDTGEVDQVGVLNLPRELIGKVNPGTYTGSFALRPDLQTRRITAVLTGLVPVPAGALKPGAAAPAAAPKAA